MHRAGQRCLEPPALIGSPQPLQQSYSPAGQDSWPNWTNLKGLQSGRGFLGNKRFFTCGTMEVVMISQESTTKDVKLVGYDFRGHTRGTLVVGIAYGCPYYKGSAIFSLVFSSTTSEKSFVP